MSFKRFCILSLPILCSAISSPAQKKITSFKVIGFYTASQDQAHISFVHEANKWFSAQAKTNHFTYDSTNNWNHLNAQFLSDYNVVLFLNTRPEVAAQRLAFEEYMKKGGSWMGFHFAAFALTPSLYPQNWDWYHNEFIGAGQYKSNTWKPTAAILLTEKDHITTKGLPVTFRSAKNEWYCWEYDLRKNSAIEILLSIDSTSFPLGTKASETWHSGYYPVAWTNKNYRMIYMNMGHNDIDYDGNTDRTLSSSFESEEQNRFILNCLTWLGKKAVSP